MQNVRTHNEYETLDLAKKIAESLHGGDIITLRGDLGSGKTTFTKGIAKVLGIPYEITSPTFLLVKQYEVSHNSIHTLYHMDLYRLDNNANLSTIGFDDIINDPQGLTIIEWPERMKEQLERGIDITFTYISDDIRDITIKENK